MNSFGIAPPTDVVLELVALARLRFDAQLGAGILAAAAGLLAVRVIVLGLSADGLAISYLRLADIGADTELALHAVDDDFQVQLAHTGDDGLPRFRVGIDTRSVGSSCTSFWIAMPSFSWSALVFGSIASWITGSGKMIDSSATGCRSSQMVSPVTTFFRPTAAQMSPARISVISSRLLACIFTRRPTRSRRPLATL